MKYYSNGTWFDEGTIAYLIDDYRSNGANSGLFRGTRNGLSDEEICSFNEFEIMEKVVAFVPLRAGGSRVGLINEVDKERALLGGKPLMAWTIEAALNSSVFDDVYAVVRSEPHLEMAERFGAKILYRPEHTVSSNSPDIDWVAWALSVLEGMYDAFAILRVTSPFRTSEHIKDAWNVFQSVRGADSLRSVRKVSEHPGKMWIVKNRLMHPLLSMGTVGQPWHSSPTQELFPCYIQTAGMEIAWTKTVIETQTIAGDYVVPFILEGEAALDINNVRDWRAAEEVIRDVKV